MAADSSTSVDVTLVANGSEVSLLVNVAERLKAEGCNVAVASVPSIGLFLHQSENYQNQVLPEGGVRFGLTAGFAHCSLSFDARSGHIRCLTRNSAIRSRNIYGRVKELIRK